MLIDFFWKGILVGIAISAPMGPIGVLCVQKTINKGKAMGFYSGMGAAAADTVYAVIAAFGLSFISNFLLKYQLIMQIIGVCVLLFLGIKIFYTNPAHQLRQQARSKRSGGFGDFVSVFFITFSNPLTILFFGAAFAAFGLFGVEHTLRAGLLLTAGILLGTTLWWFTLTSIIHAIKHKIRLKSLWWINKISGLSIVVLTVIATVGYILFKN